MSLLDEKDLNKIIKKLNNTDLQNLSNEIRDFLLTNISKTGGHLASNLGVVELTVALHSSFDSNKDKIIFDVGHQSYTHKILTGRKAEFNTLRKYKGLSGFPKISESSHDHFGVGHSSTSISAALGMAKARDLNDENYQVIAVIGDGAISNGLSFEAMNNIGNTKMIVILNDNEMSISKNVGSFSKMLTRITAKPSYISSKNSLKKILSKIPGINILSKKILSGFREMVEYDTLFTELGFKYIGPIDGHSIFELKEVFQMAKEYNGPVLLHVLTKKGKGYKFAEESPNLYHGVSTFDINKKIENKNTDYSEIFGKKITKLASKDSKIVAITAAMSDGTGLTYFKDKYPSRYFDVGIAESHALTFAAGLAVAGYKPFVAIYSTFLQRAYDELIHDICLQNLNVTIAIDRAGLVGSDGATHQGLFDLSFLSHIPNLTIIAPSSFNNLELALEFAQKFDKPLAIRYPRGNTQAINNLQKIEFGKSQIIEKGKDLTIIGVGKMTSTALNVKEILKNKYSIEVIDAVFVKPLDEKTIISSIKKTKNLFIIEDNLKKGGFGSSVLELLSDKNINIKNHIFAYDDQFIEQGTIKELEQNNNMDEKSIAKEIERLMKK